jgi:outer membrane protein OmpA-like peptidoglycan-associated protein
VKRILQSTSATASRAAARGVIAALAMLIVACVPMQPEDQNAAPSAAGTGTAPVASPAAAPAPAPPPVAPSPPPPPPPPILGFDEAVSTAAHKVFSGAPAPSGDTAAIVIDPLVDGMTGYQSRATKSIQERIVGVVKSDFPRYAVKRITPESLKQQPRILVGTFTPVNAQMKTTGAREAYRFCLVMGDLQTGKIIAKSVARARLEDPDATPTAAFADSPVWTTDPSVEAYVATCQASKVGDPIKPEYIEALLAAALVSEASDAYDEGRYKEALELYQTARKTPAGEQLRVYNGIYLAQTKLGNTEQATAAFRELVDYGLRKKRLAVKFLFRPGSVRFSADSQFSGVYGMWLHQIALETAASHECLQVTGHTSPSGPPALNDSLSLLRAEYIQSRLEGDDPALKKRTVAAGAGSRENLIGTGKDDKTDELDRRVELKPIDPCS